METMEILSEWEEQNTPVIHESYLGFRVEEVWGCFIAIPDGWKGRKIFAGSLPSLRRKIWLWWHATA